MENKIDIKEEELEDEPIEEEEGSSGEVLPDEQTSSEKGELAIDVYETETDVVIQAAIAGIKAESLDVSIEDDLVTIDGLRRNPEHDEKKTYYHQECFWGQFSREIILPEEVDSSKADATMKDGVFTLRIPKRDQEKLKKIQVKKEIAETKTD